MKNDLKQAPLKRVFMYLQKYRNRLYDLQHAKTDIRTFA